MPTYNFFCNTEEGGCGHEFEETISFDDYEKRRDEITCPKCHKHHPIQNKLNVPLHVGVSGRTLGVIADKNSHKLSADEKEAIYRKNNAYKEARPTKDLPDGMTRGKDLV